MSDASTRERGTTRSTTSAVLPPIILGIIVLGGCQWTVGPDDPGESIAAYRLQGTVLDHNGQPIEGVRVGVGYQSCFGLGGCSPAYRLGSASGPDGRYDSELAAPTPSGEWVCRSSPRALRVQMDAASDVLDLGRRVECTEEVQVFDILRDLHGTLYVNR